MILPSKSDRPDVRKKRCDLEITAHFSLKLHLGTRFEKASKPQRAVVEGFHGLDC